MHTSALCPSPPTPPCHARLRQLSMPQKPCHSRHWDILMPCLLCASVRRGKAGSRPTAQLMTDARAGLQSYQALSETTWREVGLCMWQCRCLPAPPSAPFQGCARARPPPHPRALRYSFNQHQGTCCIMRGSRIRRGPDRLRPLERQQRVGGG